MKTSIFLVLLLVLTVGCSSRKEARQEVEKKVSQESVTDGRSMASKVHAMIHGSETLNADQKAKLHAIVNEVSQKNKALTEEAFKLRSVLIKELISGKVNNKQVKILKKKIKKAENERMKNSFQAMDKFSQIVSKDPKREEMMLEWIQFDRISH